MRKMRTWVLLSGALLLPFTGAGCINHWLPIPIPVPPWVTERLQEKYGNQNDHRTPILPPIVPGTRPICEDPPDRAAMLRAIPRVARGVPYVYQEFRDDIGFSVEKLVDIIDPPRFYPLVGPAQLHHCHYKCTVFYTETVSSDYPFPFQVKKRRAEVVYIDKDHLHSVACTPEAQLSMTGDLAGVTP